MAHGDLPQLPGETSMFYAKTNSACNELGLDVRARWQFTCGQRASNCGSLPAPVCGALPAQTTLKRMCERLETYKTSIWSNTHHYQISSRNRQDFYFQPWMFDAENLWVTHLHNKTRKTVLKKRGGTILIKSSCVLKFFILHWKLVF